MLVNFKSLILAFVDSAAVTMQLYQAPIFCTHSLSCKVDAYCVCARHHWLWSQPMQLRDTRYGYKQFITSLDVQCVCNNQPDMHLQD